MDFEKFLEVWKLTARATLLAVHEPGMENAPDIVDLLIYARRHRSVTLQETIRALCPALYEHQDMLNHNLTGVGVFDRSESVESNWEQLEDWWHAALPKLMKDYRNEIVQRPWDRLIDGLCKEAGIHYTDKTGKKYEVVKEAEDHPDAGFFEILKQVFPEMRKDSTALTQLFTTLSKGTMEEIGEKGKNYLKSIAATEGYQEYKKNLEEELEEEEPDLDYLQLKELERLIEMEEDEDAKEADGEPKVEEVPKAEEQEAAEEEIDPAADDSFFRDEYDADHPMLTPVAVLPPNHAETVRNLQLMSEGIEDFANTRRDIRAFLRSRADVSTVDAVSEREDALNQKWRSLNRKADDLETMSARIETYLRAAAENPELFNRNDQKTLRRLREDIQDNLAKRNTLNEQIEKESSRLSERGSELYAPVGSGETLFEAVNSFKAIQDKELSFWRSGGHSNEFNAIKKAVREFEVNPYSTEKWNLYKACDTYLRAHTQDGRNIGGQGSEVGRLRKQAVVNLLQILSKDESLTSKLREAEAADPGRVKLNFAELEKSLASKSDAKVNNKYLTGAKKKAYAELKAEKENANIGRQRAH